MHLVIFGTILVVFVAVVWYTTPAPPSDLDGDPVDDNNNNNRDKGEPST